MSSKATHFFLFILWLFFLWNSSVFGQTISPETESCLTCHRTVTPGIVADWESSRHSRVSPGEGLKKPFLERRISASGLPDSLQNVVVGCGECHRLRPKRHADTFDHNGMDVHIVVTPEDCGVCHPQEQGQYRQNKMAHARTNLTQNDLYQDFVKAVNGLQAYYDHTLVLHNPEDQTNKLSCYFCHGTRVTVEGMVPRETAFGEMTFPDLSGWPNQGVGRINPDTSKGSCTPCHARHAFSIEVARKPYTCGECHKGPDVLAYKVYEASKMGNIYSSLKEQWDFQAVPWTIGKDFTAPTCATCHMSLLVDEQGNEIAFRSHRMNDRLYVRLFGLPYAHPQPRSPETSAMKNEAGLQLPTNLDGSMVQGPLIDQNEQMKRKQKMQSVCQGCHSTQWVNKHFSDLDHVIRTTNIRTLEATKILQQAWHRGLERGIPQRSNIFDETLEKKWVLSWFFYSNSTRLAAAMAGADYAVFDNGRWQLALNLREMEDWLELKTVADSVGGTERLLP